MTKLLLVFCVLGLCFACSQKAPEETASQEAPVTPGIPQSTPERPIVVIETDSGRIVTEFYPQVAPITCDSILSLVNQGFYNGLTIHRIVPNFVIQGGDPLGNGTGNAGFQIPAEFSSRQHVEGTLSMARAGDDINSSSCQFFICLRAVPHLDGQYNLFGQVISGMEVVHKLASVPTGPMGKPLEPVIIRRMFENK